MAGTLILCIIGISWLGALTVWGIGDRHEKLQHSLAVLFSLCAGIVSLFLLNFIQATPAVDIPL
ncbi:MAG: hypothetical protein ACKOBD_05395, partial [Chloroflexota bacterium]